MYKNKAGKMVHECSDCLILRTNKCQNQIDRLKNSNNETGVDNCKFFVKAQCKHCTRLGDPIACDDCNHGFGWICNAPNNTDGTHVHPDMAMCLSAIPKEKEDDDSGELQAFSELWFNSNTPTVWCQKYAHPLHRLCPVHLNYENLPEPFKKIAGETEHIGETGKTVCVKPEICIKCPEMVRNGGICDPV